MTKAWNVIPLVLLSALLASCGDGEQGQLKQSEAPAKAVPEPPKEERKSVSADPANKRPEVSLVTIAPGPADPVNETNEALRKVIEDPEQIAAGKQLYQAFNCVGCHFNGGGGMGPPLMDKTWIYGSSPEQIVSTLVQGRPAGMPSYREMTTEDQRWQLTAYVLSLGERREAKAQ